MADTEAFMDLESVPWRRLSSRGGDEDDVRIFWLASWSEIGRDGGLFFVDGNDVWRLFVWAVWDKRVIPLSAEEVEDEVFPERDVVKLESNKLRMREIDESLTIPS